MCRGPGAGREDDADDYTSYYAEVFDKILFRTGLNVSIYSTRAIHRLTHDLFIRVANELISSFEACITELRILISN